jgi:futalosine hydrolase
VEGLKGAKCKSLQGKDFYRGILRDRPIVVAISGVGKANAAHVTGLLIEKYSPSMLVNLGVAGAYPYLGLKIGDVVIAQREIYGDEGLLCASGEFQDMKSLGLPLARCSGKALFNLFDTFVPHRLAGYLPQGNFLTVSTCTGSLKRATELYETYHCVCENMEGAAVAHIAALNNLAFVEIRGISNLIGDRGSGGIDRRDLERASEAVQAFFIEEALPAL